MKEGPHETWCLKIYPQVELERSSQNHLAQCPYSTSRETEVSEERDLPETTSPSDSYSVGARKSLLLLRESLGLFTV